MQIWAVLVALFLGGSAAAQGWQEPQRGTQTRKALMDALRPHATWILGSPVEFVVHDLRRAGNLAFASVSPQRPGGGRIDIYGIPAVQRGDMGPGELDNTDMQALFFRSGETWVAVQWAIGATDVWYSWSPICAVWRPVIPEVCHGL